MATEEFLLLHLREPAVMLWRNAPAVIIGKNQDARAEVDFAFARTHGIRVVRRLSGGGAVFHDLGNVNYTFITPGDAPSDFHACAAPILRAVAALGIDCKSAGRNDLLARDMDGEYRKFSGTASCVFRRPDGTAATMHHGTLLFSADFSALAGALTPDREKLATKGIRSTRARVVNLRTLLPTEKIPDTAAFLSYLEAYFLREGAVKEDFSPADKRQIAALAENKYATERWLFGKFGASDKICRRRFPFGTVAVSLAAAPNADGTPTIARLAFSGDFIGQDDIAVAEKALLGAPLAEEPLRARLAALPISAYIGGAAPEEIAALLTEAHATEII